MYLLIISAYTAITPNLTEDEKMLDIWMSSIARAGGIEVPPGRFIVEPSARRQATPLESQPEPHRDGRLVKFARWVEARLAPPAGHCEA